MQSKLFVSVFVLLFSLVPHFALGSDVLLDREEACLSLAGEWDGDRACAVTDFLFEYRDSLTIAEGWTLTVRGTSPVVGTVINHGTLITEGLVVNGSVIYNRALLINRGWIHTHAPLVNESQFENEGFLDVCSGAIFNYAYLHNVALVDNWGRILNTGLLINDGQLFNNDLGFENLLNEGAFANREFVNNDGIILCSCGSAWYGEGELRGMSPAFEGCPPSAAVQRIEDDCIDWGPQSQGLLTKDQLIPLLVSLGRAAKRFEMGRNEDAADLLTDFGNALGALVDRGALPFYLGEASTARALGLIDDSQPQD